MYKKLLLTCILAASTQAHADFSKKYDFSFSLETAKGVSAYAPTQVFTDGDKTWIQFRNPEISPVILAEEGEVKYKVEFPYIVMEGVYPHLTVVLAGERVAEIDYSGHYASRSVGVMFPSSKPIAVNSPAPMPIPVEEVKAPQPVNLDVAVEQPIDKRGDLVTIPEDKIVHLSLNPPLLEVEGEVIVETNPTAVEEEKESVFVKYKGKLSKPDFVKIKKWVNQGGTLTLKGASNWDDEGKRAKSVVRRANEMKRILVTKGRIKKEAITIDETGFEVKAESGVNIILN